MGFLLQSGLEGYCKLKVLFFYGGLCVIPGYCFRMSERNDMFQAISHDHVDSDVEEGRSGPKESIDMVTFQPKFKAQTLIGL